MRFKINICVLCVFVISSHARATFEYNCWGKKLHNKSLQERKLIQQIVQICWGRSSGCCEEEHSHDELLECFNKTIWSCQGLRANNINNWIKFCYLVGTVADSGGERFHVKIHTHTYSLKTWKSIHIQICSHVLLKLKTIPLSWNRYHPFGCIAASLPVFMW